MADREDSERWVEARESNFDRIWKPLNTRNVIFSLSPTGNKGERLQKYNEMKTFYICLVYKFNMNLKDTNLAKTGSEEHKNAIEESSEEKWDNKISKFSKIF